MKFEWEEIYNNSHIQHCSFFEATYRAKVINGWLIRHEVCTDYQYEYMPEEEEAARCIHDEGYQNVTNTITFIADPKHEWEIEKE